MFAEEEAAALRAAAVGDALEDLVRRRVAGEPLEVLLGHAVLDGVRVALGPDVFVPRQRSLLLVDQARARPGDVVVDLCCGSGALGLVLARRTRGIVLHACDLDPTACHWARRNLDGVGTVHEGDLLDALPPDVVPDLVLLNAPYVPTEQIAHLPPEARDHEPTLALDGGADGVDVHRRAASQAARRLRPGGVVLVETGRHQVPLTRAAFGPSWATEVVHDPDRGATAVRATRE